jgi:hypothetical protein
VDAEVAALVGCANAKTFFRDLKAKVAFVEAGGSELVLKTCMNIVLTGNPGTGKTTFSRLLFRFLHAYGILPRDVFVEKNALELKGQYLGQTAPRVKDAVAEAMGGCLFLDEAYALAADGYGRTDSFSNEAVRTLLTEVENNRSNLLVVLAGYKDKMGRLMKADPGLPRRFPLALHLDDYSAAELAEIACNAAGERFGLGVEAGLRPKLAAHIAARHSHEVADHNAGLAINLVEAAMGRMAGRLVRGGLGAGAALGEPVLVAADFEIGAEPAPVVEPVLTVEEPEPRAAKPAKDFDGLVELLEARLGSSKEQQLHAQVSALRAELAAERKLRGTLAAVGEGSIVVSPPASPVDDLRRCRSAGSGG